MRRHEWLLKYTRTDYPRKDFMKKFDKEYSTQYVPEMKYLQDNGINYAFVKTVNGVTTYKYTKSPELFAALEIFYAQN